MSNHKFDIDAYVKKITSANSNSTGRLESHIDNKKFPIYDKPKVDWCSRDIQNIVSDNKPYYLFITLMFNKNTSFQEICCNTSEVIQQFNTRIFGKDYKSIPKYVEGFAIFEKPMSKGMERETFVNILIKNQKKFSKLNLSYVEYIFIDAAYSISARAKKLILYENYDIDLQHDCEVLGRRMYDIEQIWDYDIDCIKIIDKNGLSNDDILDLL